MTTHEFQSNIAYDCHYLWLPLVDVVTKAAPAIAFLLENERKVEAATVGIVGGTAKVEVGIMGKVGAHDLAVEEIHGTKAFALGRS